MFPVATFGISLGALIALFVFKEWELRRNIKCFAALRARLSDFIEAHVMPLQEKLPEAGKEHAALIFSQTKKYVLSSLLHLLHLAEGYLLRAFLFIRGKRTLLHSNDSVSPFLKDVAEHKKNFGNERNQSL